MRNLARRAGRFAIVLVMAGAAVFGPAAPAVAAPDTLPPHLEEDCGEPVDTVFVCRVANRTDPENVQIGALVRANLGNLEGALVVLELCDGETCRPVEVTTGQDAVRISTNLVPWGSPAGDYRANVSWVDENRNMHTGVVHPDY